MSGYEVTAAELFGAAAMAEQAAADARHELARAQAAAKDLFGPGWRGAAARAFAEGWHDWAGGARTVLAALDEMAEVLTITAREYEQNELGLTSGFEQMVA